MFKAPLIVIASAALLIGSAGAVLGHSSTIEPNASRGADIADECGAQGEQEGDQTDTACATDQPGENAAGTDEKGEVEHGSKGETGATGEKGAQSGADDEQDGDHSD